MAMACHFEEPLRCSACCDSGCVLEMVFTRFRFSGTRGENCARSACGNGEGMQDATVNTGLHWNEDNKHTRRDLTRGMNEWKRQLLVDKRRTTTTRSQ